MSETLPDFLRYPMFGSFEPARTVQVPGHPHSHEVRVWLPPSYRHADRTYPTLWVTDNALELASAAMMGSSLGYAPELILVAIGAPTDLPMQQFQQRRQYDFATALDELNPKWRDSYTADDVGGGPRFRDFLVDQLRPKLAAEYRMDPHDHGLAGFSGGANFGLFTLFTRPEGFTKYVLGSPGSAQDYLRMEAEYADEHADLDARVFFAVGEAEGADHWTATGDVWTSVASLTEALVRRGYPSLELTTRVLPGLDHFSAWPSVYIEGVRVVWRELVAPPTRADLDAIVRDQLSRAQHKPRG